MAYFDGALGRYPKPIAKVSVHSIRKAWPALIGMHLNYKIIEEYQRRSNSDLGLVP